MSDNIPNLQVVLENDRALLLPLNEEDFDILYAVASDPAVWEQHPNKNRYEREVFANYFQGAMEHRGGYKIIDKQSGEVAGSSRYYEYNAADKSISVGYTFYGTKHWGTGINTSVKKLMLDYIFQFVDKVYFHIGATNVRSQIAITRLGAVKVKEEELAYYGEPVRLNCIYEMDKQRWESMNNK